MVVLRQAYADGDKDSEYVFVNKRTGKPYTTIQKQWERIPESSIGGIARGTGGAGEVGKMEPSCFPI